MEHVDGIVDAVLKHLLLVERLEDSEESECVGCDLLHLPCECPEIGGEG